MKKLFLSVIVLLGFSVAKAQFVYKIKADSVLITNDSCTAELIIENSTKNVKGFLVNKGNGRTEFRRATQLTDSSFIIAGDTVIIRGTGSAASLWQINGSNNLVPKPFAGTRVEINKNLRVTDSSFIATGTLGSGTIPISGGGLRMMWYPGKAAFRAGEISSTEWNDSLIGLYSFAAGLDNIARGDYSVNFGYANTVSGNGSISLGGVNNSISGDNSLAAGSLNTVAAEESIAVGIQNTISSGGQSSMVSGRLNSNSAQNSIVAGRNNNNQGNNALIMGNNNSNNVANATVFGLSNTITDGTGFPGGPFIAGTNCNVSGLSAVAFSQGQLISGNYGFATGSSNIIRGHYSSVFGALNRVNYDNQMVIGKYNDTTTKTMFEIGNGTAHNARKTIFYVDSVGRVKIDSASDGSSDNFLLTWDRTAKIIKKVSKTSIGGSYTFSTGLTNASSTITNNLSTGISGGQTAVGGTASGDSLRLSSTSNATKGKIFFGTSTYDEANDRLGIGTTSPGVKLDVKGSEYAGLFGGNGPSNTFYSLQLRNDLNDPYHALEFGIDGSTYPTAEYGATGEVGYMGTTGEYPFSFFTNNSMRLFIAGTGNIGVGVNAPSSRLHLPAGTATVNTAPLKFTSGSLLTTPEVGAMEFLTDKAYLTITTGVSRKQFVLSDTTLALNTIPTVGTGGRLQSDANFKWFNGSKTLDMTGTQNITSFITGSNSTPSLQIETDWTTTGTPTALLIDVNDNSSNSASALMDLRNSASSQFLVRKDGNIGVGITNPTAKIHLKAGSSSANTAPLKFTSGTNLSTPESGAVEFDGTNYYATASTTRYTLAKTLTTTSTLDFGSTAAGAKTDLTVTVSGAADGDVVSIGVPNGSTVANGSFTAWVSASNTVTVRFTNNDPSMAYDPASGTFRVSVLKY